MDNEEDSSKKNINQLQEKNKQELQNKFKLEKLILEERDSMRIIPNPKEELQVECLDKLFIGRKYQT